MSKALARADQPYFIITFSPSQKSKLDYHQDEIDRLKDVIEGYKKLINETIEKGKYLKSLTDFRNIFCLECIVHNTKKTIIQCTESIKRNQCTFHETCKDRKRIFDLINP